MTTPVSSEMVTPTNPSLDPIAGDTNLSGDIPLEKILEEDSSYGDERSIQTAITSSTPTLNDKKLLLGNGHTHSVMMTNI